MKNRIREIRKAYGISQIELAKYLGIAQNTLSYWEQGKYDADIASLQKIADYFQCSVDCILCRVEFLRRECACRTSEIKYNNRQCSYDLEAISNRIKALKKARKLSNEALANIAGIPKGTLSKILGSETKDPQISNIIKISQALGVTADYIIFGKEEPKYNDVCLEMFSCLNYQGQNKVLDYMRDLIESGNYSPALNVIERPKGGKI